MKKTLWIIVALVVLVAAFLAVRYKAPQVSAPTSSSDDNTAAITGDLDSIGDVGAIDEEFKAIDQDLNSL